MIQIEGINLSIKSSGYCISSHEGDTILHLLITLNNIPVFNTILEMDGLDIINSENTLGDTPLLLACKSMKLNFIMSLFSRENLDYKHRNKDGKDALEIVQIMAKPYTKGQFVNAMAARGFNGGGFFNNRNIQVDPKDINDKEKREYYEKIINYF